MHAGNDILQLKIIMAELHILLSELRTTLSLYFPQVSYAYCYYNTGIYKCPVSNISLGKNQAKNIHLTNRETFCIWRTTK